MLEQFVFLAGLVGWILKIYSWIHIAAFLLSWINADPNNSIVYWVRRITLPMWHWVGQRLPMKISSFAPIFALMLVIYAEIAVPGIIRSLGATIDGNVEMDAGLRNMLFYLVYGGLYIVSNIVGFVFLLAVLWFVFTLVNPPLNNPIIRAIWFLVDPLITPIQRFVPRARIDISPLVLALIAFLLRDVLVRIMQPIQAGLII
ncbi:MAG: YggT family protein [Proteobacteria bacterium]|nr:YggT family protein [Pseudomonadota bacterium]